MKQELSSMTEVLVYWIKFLILAVLAYIAPVQSLMIATGVLVFVDFFAGVARARKLREPITSHKMKRTVVKGLVYQAAIMLGLMIETYFLSETPIVKLIAATIAMVELKSINENIKIAFDIDLLKTVIDKLQTQKEVEK